MAELLNMKNIKKSFSGVQVLHGINLAIEEGEVLGLLGENGAGKSTLMKILSGVYPIEEGEIYLENKKIIPENPKHAQNLGISIIHQELNLVENLTVAENIFLGRIPVNKWGKVEYQKLFSGTQEILNSYEFDLDAKANVKELSVGKQQMIEIAKAVSFNSKVILMDEPTSALTDEETEKLFNLIRRLQKQKIGIVFISHKLEEIFELCSKVKVLRDGKDMGEHDISNIDEDKLIQLMVGREISERFPTKNNKPGDEILRIEHISKKDVLDDVSFSVRRGEVFGIAGLMGAGRSELMNAIFGVDRKDAGEIYIDNKKVDIKCCKDAIKNGIGYVPEDRKKQGLILCFSVEKNSTLAVLDKIKGKFACIDRKKEKLIAEKQIEKLSIKVQNKDQKVKLLSGGNQQKIVLGKWLEIEPKILILDDPTRGIDVGTKAEIYNLINKLTKKGHSVILISSEMPEVISMSDRIAVMSEGKITKILNKEEANQETIMKYAIGGN
ncbi:sugar ABC transporter ATP-binding protein [Clostridium botulinum]|uniref:Sugar ABC transporter ATP-binding protein n=1 Tax=Clostridium botulinum TaxID=1491 RepID=A0A846J8D0_CLOBO|nr:sugar ABC transporter ATP-binding protein [Clostridium botulinum]ACA55530.1 ribose import ATP-binding protein RbsA [Clostridium botulinum A3 str. Loch Maree]NFH66583.1 sugar ABC transporter ATP-binding protein [Clostridium botulinum]NFJ10338.1 sugar ABC transporter ATP-binding protein [Clostridium botulinum]NFK15712.1 sugar ABC transporter ATP-binding protein [Clostridium botulinum]NFM95773.1 sugar ABC transporter ATP-binding protein [Clostridium botulinum]